MSNECNTSLDCLELEGIPKFCYIGYSALEDNFCDCVNWFGWKGEDCDEISSQLVFYFISQLLILLFSCFIMLTLIRSWYIYTYFGNQYQKKLDPIVITALFIFAALLFMIIHACLNLPALIDPSRYELITYKEFHQDTEDINVEHGKVASFSLFLATSFFFLTTLQVFHTWYEIIERASIFDTSRSKAKKALITVKVVICVYTIVAIAVIAADERIVSIFIGAVLGISLSIAYPLMYLYLSRTLAKLEVRTNDFIAKTVALIRYCCLVNSVCLVISVVTMLILFVLFIDVDYRFDPGDFNYVLFIREISTYVGLYMIAVMSWYVNTMLARSRSMPKGRFMRQLWDKWDLKHEQIFSTNSRASSVFVSSML